MMSTLLYPLVTFILLVVCVAYWGTTALYPFIVFVAVCVCIHDEVTLSLLFSEFSLCTPLSPPSILVPPSLVSLAGI